MLKAEAWPAKPRRPPQWGRPIVEGLYRISNRINVIGRVGEGRGHHRNRPERCAAIIAQRDTAGFGDFALMLRQ